MQIEFKARISGLAKIAYSVRKLEVKSYKVLSPGDLYLSPGEPKLRRNFGYALQVNGDGGSVYELKPGTTVKELK